MSQDTLQEILASYRSGECTAEEVADTLRKSSIADLGFANVDLDRSRRRGVPEVIFGENKTPEHITEIIGALRDAQQNILATRISPEVADAVISASEGIPLVYDSLARCIYTERPNTDLGIGRILVVCAGTSDLPVAAEAALTARLCGNTVDTLNDVGVAGLHRLLGHLDTLRSANVVIVCAGMEGALPSVVAGLVSRPIVAVPTSVGYGASFEGLTALLSMMNSCAAGVTVVNIDNGFGAGYAASVINRRPD